MFTNRINKLKNKDEKSTEKGLTQIDLISSTRTTNYGTLNPTSKKPYKYKKVVSNLRESFLKAQKSAKHMNNTNTKGFHSSWINFKLNKFIMSPSEQTQRTNTNNNTNNNTNYLMTVRSKSTLGNKKSIINKNLPSITGINSNKGNTSDNNVNNNSSINVNTRVGVTNNNFYINNYNNENLNDNNINNNNRNRKDSSMEKMIKDKLFKKKLLKGRFLKLINNSIIMDTEEADKQVIIFCLIR
jgi:hypothetical protein